MLRCVLRGFHTSAAAVLKSLDSHHSAVIRRIAQKAARLLSTLPRSTAFSMEHEFVSAHRSWLASVRKLISALEQEMDEMEAEAGNTEEVEDERLEYEAQFRCLLELMAGVKDRIFEACEDWREALGAWGTLVHPTLKRDDVPTTAAIILDKFPVDATLASEAVQQHLIRGEVRQAVQRSQEVDVWLGAHLGDLADKVGLLEDEVSLQSDLRQQLVLQYARICWTSKGCGASASTTSQHVEPRAGTRCRTSSFRCHWTAQSSKAKRRTMRWTTATTRGWLRHPHLSHGQSKCFAHVRSTAWRPRRV